MAAAFSPVNSTVRDVTMRRRLGDTRNKSPLFFLKKQKGALHFAGTSAPKSKVSMFFRNQIMKLLRIQWIAALAVGRDLADNFTLPEY